MLEFRTGLASIPRFGRFALLAIVAVQLYLGGMTTGFGQNPPPPQLAGMALIEALRGGGYNLYFRHAATVWAQNDLIEQAGDWTSCDPARVRQLSPAGRQTASRLGAAMRRLQIPVAKVFASPYCRTVQTATAMDLGAVETTTDVMNLRVADHFGGREAIVASARKRLATAPPPRQNHVFVAHGNVAIQATGVYPGEGEGLIFRPLGGEGFEFVGRLTPAQWQQLAQESDAEAGRPRVIDPG